ncbi:hypothetical protein A2686_04315 [Candidatus Woesebacteria bacterium RIFCSPHIGHO2_01_FULL_38_10]|uniref:Uncharacterized protein n=1 Tax=Candidatus Woesebacteria bacterium RIFCSPLOWO2_01_FULL_39_10b TaxID=1802517 RepID=A0A1F8B8D1_9BACT|nr:MAG: hypothetical protein A2686_04315 [Candidatus Woesebacteria bacterium RIFCSPHIGHO2_01_FULL_38_10]OGM60304.1 MAG: hypothetical protein A2892_03085 [Candidatus Woesebacteria bacterium RIFCSPLOWO2_01_FULL_39_10b]
MIKDRLVTRAVRLSAGALVKAFGNSVVGESLPRLGRYKGNSEVIIPHLLGKPSLEEVNRVGPRIGYGSRVIVYTTLEEE